MIDLGVHLIDLALWVLDFPEVERIDLFDLLGVRIVQLTYNKRNLVGDGCLEPGNAGLSVYGREVVAGLNARRMMVDVSHAAQRTIAEAIAEIGRAHV